MTGWSPLHNLPNVGLVVELNSPGIADCHVVDNRSHPELMKNRKKLPLSVS